MNFKTLLDLIPDLSKVAIVFNDSTLSGDALAFENLKDTVLEMKVTNIEARDDEIWAWLNFGVMERDSYDNKQEQN